VGDDPGPRSEAAFRRVGPFVGLGLLFMLLLVLIVGLARTRHSTPTTPEEVAAEIESRPATRESAIALRTHFPNDYRAMLRRLAAAGREGGREGLAREGACFMQAFYARKAGAMASAPDAELDQVADAMLALLRGLRGRNDPLCGQMVTHHFDFSASLPDEAMPAGNRMSMTMILTAHAGETGRGRRRGTPTQADLAALMERAEAIDPRVTATMEEGAMERSTPPQQCAVFLALIQAATELPPPVTANIMAGAFLEAGREQSPSPRR
jgi:hypothetical protein